MVRSSYHADGQRDIVRELRARIASGVDGLRPSEPIAGGPRNPPRVPK
jgi:hypothetical protein